MFHTVPKELFYVDSEGHIHFSLYEGSVTGITNDMSTADASHFVTDNKWRHIAVTRVDFTKTWSFYINGEVKHFHIESSSPSFGGYDNMGDIYLGDDWSAGGPGLAGYQDGDKFEARMGNMYIDQIRITGMARYGNSDFDKPTEPFCAHGLVTLDSGSSVLSNKKWYWYINGQREVGTE